MVLLTVPVTTAAIRNNDSLTSATNCTSQHVVRECNFCLWTDVIVVPALVMCGISANVVCILVINKVRFGFPSTKILIKTLAIFDILYLTGSIFYQTLSSVQFYSDWLSEQRPYDYMKPFLWPYMSFLQTTETWLIVAIAADRFIAVRYPLSSCTLCSRTKGYVAVTVIAVVSIVYNIPHMFEFAYMSKPCIKYNSTTAPTNLLANPTYLLVYKSILTTLVKFVIPLWLLSFFSLAVVRSIHKAASRRKELVMHRSIKRGEVKDSGKRKKKDHSNVTPVLLVVIVVFVLCQLVGLLLYTYHLAHLSFLSDKQYRVILTVSNLMLVINAAANFLIYICFSRAFVAGFSKLCVCKSRRDSHMLLSGSYITNKAYSGNGVTYYKASTTRITTL